jgi:hypothetical protein
VHTAPTGHPSIVVRHAMRTWRGISRLEGVCLGVFACRLRCDITTAGDILAAVAAASPNLTQLELRCSKRLYACGTDVMCPDLLQLPPSALAGRQAGCCKHPSCIWRMTCYARCKL